MRSCFSSFQFVSNVCYLYQFWPSPLAKGIFGIFALSFTFFIPLIILMYCYGRIVWVLTRRTDSKLSGGSGSRNGTGSRSGSGSGSSDTFYVARTNTIKTFLTVAVCFVICWSNIEVYSAFYYLSSYLGNDTDWNSTYFNFTIFMAFLNCTINPFIYLIKYKDFQEAIRNCLFRKKSISEISARKQGTRHQPISVLSHPKTIH